MDCGRKPASLLGKTARTGGTERILYVDDEESILHLASLALTRLGYEVETLEDPRRALEMFRAGPDAFDLMVTDMTMPAMTGIALAEAVWAVRPELPVILCTGMTDLDELAQLRELGFTDFLQKPMRLDEIVTAVRSALNGTLRIARGG